MASTDHLSIDPSGVRGAAASVATGATTAGPQPVAITPSAQDSTSALIANTLNGMVSDLINATAAANARTVRAAGQLNTNVDTYEQQEAANQAALSDPGAGAPVAVGAQSAPPVVLVPPVAIEAPASAGTTPTSGRDIATLIHGGPGPEGLDAAATLLATHADQLDQAAERLRSARWQADASWDSGAAEAATTHLVGLESEYTDQAAQARELAQHATTQAANFRRAKSQIPTPEHFENLERGLRYASQANANPANMGRYAPVVAKYQTELAAANSQAVNGFGSYTGGAAPLAQMEIQRKVASTTPPSTGHPDPAGSAPEPGKGDGDDLNTSGPGAPGGDPSGNPAADLLGAPSGMASDMMSTVLPAVLGGVAGMAGGLLGALSGAGQKVQEAGSQLAGGLAQGASSAMGAMQSPGGGDSDKPGGPGGDPLSDMGDGGGGDSGAGGTEPASSVDGPLSAAPASAAAAPAAAPATYSPGASAPAVSAAGGAPGGMPMGGAMMPPPMMGGRGGAGAGQGDPKLYPERKLKLETPPNSEPVRGRREQRAARTERTGEGK